MATFVSAGNYILERDDSLYATAISPTIIGIVGTATKGPTDEAVLCTSEGYLVEVFGRPRTKDYGMHAAIEALKACRLVYFVRIAGAAADYGYVNVMDAGSGATSASIGPSSNTETFNLLGVNSVESPEGTRTATMRCDYNNGAGLQTDQDATVAATQPSLTSGNTETFDLQTIAGGANPVYCRVAVDGGPLQTITVTPADVTGLGGVYTAVTAEILASLLSQKVEGGSARADGAGTAVILASDTYGTDAYIQIQAPAAGPNLNDAVNGLNMSTAAVQGTGDCGNLGAVTGAELAAAIEADLSDLTVTVGATGTITISTDNTGATTALNIKSAAPNTMIGSGTGQINLTPLDTTVNGTDSTAAANTVKFSAATKGTHSSRIKVVISASSALAGTVKLVVKIDDTTVETYDKLYKSPTPVTGGYALITTINSGSTDGVWAASEYITASDLNAAGENPAAGTYTLSAGNDGDNWTSGTVIGTVVSSTRTGMQVFGDPDQVYINVLATPGVSYAAVISEGLDICSLRGDCIYVADAPSGLTAANVTAWHNGDNSLTVTVDQESRTETNSTTFNSSYGALYWPFLTIYDKYNEQNISVPPSAAVLRTYAYTDQVADPWFAPAGPNRTQGTAILDMEENPTQGERDLMQMPGNNVNPFANIAGVGVVLMGQKTLQRSPTALDRVNVRRLLLSLEKVIAQSVFYLDFEPNDSTMWRRFVNLVTPTLADVKSRRGLYAYNVVADESTTTDTLINQNTFLGKIFLQPTKAAEILITQFNLVPTGASFEEFVSS